MHGSMEFEAHETKHFKFWLLQHVNPSSLFNYVVITKEVKKQNKHMFTSDTG